MSGFDSAGEYNLQWGNIRVTLGNLRVISGVIYRDNGKVNGSYHLRLDVRV